jgi:guanylate kinase
MSDLSIFHEVEEQKKRGVLLVLTGPSGSGKDTVLAKLQEQDPSLIKIITTTSRSPREGEAEGSPYYFVSRERFEQLIAEEAFFEWVEFRSELYGTQKKTLQEALSTGNDVIWRIEAKGVKNIKEKIKQMVPRSVFVFLIAENIEDMHTRVVKAEGVQGAQKRWNEPLVIWEARQFKDCDYLVVNADGKLDETVSSIRSIIQAKRRETL